MVLPPVGHSGLSDPIEAPTLGGGLEPAQPHKASVWGLLFLVLGHKHTSASRGKGAFERKIIF